MKRKTSRKTAPKRRSVKRKVSRKRRSAKRKVSRKRRSAKRKVSRKRRSVKKKTVKELRAECKAQGLVYDPNTKKCRPSKRRSRKAVVRKSRKPRPCKYGRNPVTGKCNKKPTKRRSVKRRSRKAVVRKSRKRRSVKRRSRKAVVRKSRKRRSVKRRSRKAAVVRSRKVANTNINNASKTFVDTLSSLNLSPGDSLTPDQADLVQQAIYNYVASIVASSPDLSALSELLPSGDGGNIYYLLHYLDLMTQFQVQMLVFKSQDEYRKLIEQITKDLKAYLDEQHKQLQVYVQKMLQQAPEIVHKKADSFASKNLTWQDWNKLGYTQIEPKYDIKKRIGCDKNSACGKVKASIKDQHWSCFKSCGHGIGTKSSLSQIANFHVDGNKDEVVMFHGSAGVAKSSLKKSVDWKRGGGYLGTGFYLTFNPNEAKIYACNAARRSNDSNGIVLEVVIKNASKFFARDEEGWWDASDKGHFARNYRTDMKGWWDQINCRDEIIRNMTIRRIHVIDTKNLRHYSKDRDPGSTGYYTVDRNNKKGHLCKK